MSHKVQTGESAARELPRGGPCARQLPYKTYEKDGSLDDSDEEVEVHAADAGGRDDEGWRTGIWADHRGRGFRPTAVFQNPN